MVETCAAMVHGLAAQKDLELIVSTDDKPHQGRRKREFTSADGSARLIPEGAASAHVNQSAQMVTYRMRGDVAHVHQILDSLRQNSWPI
jgi:hypothetical protein